MKKQDIKRFHSKWTDCIHCRKILKAIDEEFDEMNNSIETDEKIVREPHITENKYNINGYKKMLENRLNRDINRYHDVDFSIGDILEKCIDMKMGTNTFQDHLKHHLLYFKALKKVGRYKITLGDNYISYTFTTFMIEFINRLEPNNFDWHDGIGFFSGLKLSDIETMKNTSEILRTHLKNTLIDHDLKTVHILPDLLIMDVRTAILSSKKKKKKR